MQATLRDAQMEAARVWMDVAGFHLARRMAGEAWPGRKDLQERTKGKYRLHSQSVQMICHQLLANVEATGTRRINEPKSRSWLKYPYREKKYFPVYWPAQAVSYDKEKQRLVLPMGRGRRSLTFKMDLDFAPGGAKLVWNEGYEIHLVRSDVEPAEASPGDNLATVDLGEIHQAAVVTNTGQALIVSGRGIRSHKRLLSKQLGEIAARRSRCEKGSRRDRKLQKARRKRSLFTARRVRDLRHKGTRAVIRFCEENHVGTLYVGDPRGVREKDCGRHHNQRVARWEVGKDIDYLGHKAERARISCSTGDERGTSSRCPRCGHRQKVKGREWRCKAAGCGFVGPRDVVGGANMHEIAYGKKVTFPAKVTYLRPGPERASRGLKNPGLLPERSRSPDTGPREVARPPRLLGTSLPQGGASCRRQAAVGKPSVCRKAQPTLA